MIRFILAALLGVGLVFAMAPAKDAAAAPSEGPQGRGCCSWHGGVCGCVGSSVQCCDGTASPSCRC